MYFEDQLEDHLAGRLNTKKIPHPSLHAFVGILKERGWRGQFDAREEEEGLL